MEALAKADERRILFLEFERPRTLSGLQNRQMFDEHPIQLIFSQPTW
jgi:hypothetical protein